VQGVARDSVTSRWIRPRLRLWAETLKDKKGRAFAGISAVHALSVFGQTLLSASQPTRRKRALTINPKSIYYEKHSI
jgi:hypothetical protein